ncbi:hypothetical protein H7K20_12585 [Priestia aryabhattai]|uniref:HNH endonuclease n=1 Tax=Priestia aryabhattai TaxID=412384 RepID=UPI001C8F07EA|nr:HNH endonuclease [Priestia aryabhattai]MBY0027938.1 hypothetical protein [Priestia aryabhattai]
MIDYNLQEYEGDSYFQIYKDIADNKIDQKHKRVMNIIQNRVNARYSEYSNHKRELSQVEKNLFYQRTLVKKVLLSCYGNNVALGVVKANIKEIQREVIKGTCPYCLIGEQNTFDHYIPKSAFPEFSVMPLNLIPSCERCNLLKSECWLENNKRKIVNLYYDAIPTVKFLYTELHYLEANKIPRARFWLEKNDIDNTTFERITSHFNRLKLLDRYQEKASGELVGIIKTISDYKSLAFETIKNMLRVLRTKEYNKFGDNYWMTSLYDAILEDDQFINNIMSGQFDFLLSQAPSQHQHA